MIDQPEIREVPDEPAGVNDPATEDIPHKKLTLRTPDEILAMHFDDSDIIIGDRLVALGQSCVMAGAGGLGKSRLLVQMAACAVTGRKFLAFDTKGKNLRWFFLQTENSNRRLQHDLRGLRKFLGANWPAFDEKVVFHTIETDVDGFVSLDSLENQAAVQNAILESKANIIVADPLNDFGVGDINKDADMRTTVQTLSRICRKGDPTRAVLVAHHARTGKAGAATATGFDRSSFARNSKALFAWTRAQINLAPVDAESNDRLIVACGKCSNGREFLPFGIKLNLETMIYECDPTVDVTAWEAEVTGSRNKGPLMTPDQVKEFCRIPKTKAELAHAILEDCGCARTVAYRYIKRAEAARKIQFNAKTENYAAK